MCGKETMDSCDCFGICIQNTFMLEFFLYTVVLHGVLSMSGIYHRWAGFQQFHTMMASLKLLAGELLGTGNNCFLYLLH